MAASQIQLAEVIPVQDKFYLVQTLHFTNITLLNKEYCYCMYVH